MTITEEQIKGTRYYDLTRVCLRQFPKNYDLGRVHSLFTGKKTGGDGKPLSFSIKDFINMAAISDAGKEAGLELPAIIEDLEQMVRKMDSLRKLAHTLVYEVPVPYIPPA